TSTITTPTFRSTITTPTVTLSTITASDFTTTTTTTTTTITLCSSVTSTPPNFTHDIHMPLVGWRGS
ncbi:hypothetical protein FHG87_024869, partial [Trinorchestia longiramus]